MNRRHFLKVSVAGAAAAMAWRSSAAVFAQGSKDIVDTAVAAGSFKTLAAALGAAGLVETLKGAGPFTVFAPTDEAFAKLPAGTVESLLKPENKNQLIAILTYHVVAGSVKAADVVKLTSATTVNGAAVAIKVVDGAVFVGDAKVVTTDIMASNGVIHVIDSVLLPPPAPTAMLPETGSANAAAQEDIVDTAIAAGSFKTLAAALGAAGLVETLKGAGPFTVFAPTDEAFAKLPAGTVESLLKPENKNQLIAILTYHVVAGSVKAADVVKLTSATTVNGAAVAIKVVDGAVFVGDAKVVTTDIMASNGVIHVIDAVLLPPPAAMLPETGSAGAAAQEDIVATALKAGGFATLAAALGAAGLVDVLKGKGPFTVFAPTDEAFAKLPAGTVESLLKPENKQQLIDVLTYHVAAGRIPASTVVRHGSIMSLYGARIDVTAGDTVKLNDATVIAADVAASNGVIHAIDTVLLPPSDVIEVARAAGSFKTLLAAVEAAGLTDALRKGTLTVFAPTDDAFAKLPAGTVETLLKPENLDQLKKILTYHVIRKDYDAAQVSRYRTLRTMQGQLLQVRRSSAGVTINGAAVLAADVFARNGVVHVVDTVLLPK